MPNVLRELDRQGRRRGDGGDEGNAPAEERFLDDLERRAAADTTARGRQRKRIAHQHGGRQSCPPRCAARRPRPRRAAAVAREQAGGVQAACLVENRLRAARRRAGNCPASSTRESCHVRGERRQRPSRSDSMVSRPQSPHEELVVTLRRSASMASSACGDPFMSRALTMFSGCSADGSVQYSMVPRSSALFSTPSASRNPAASSRSAPGVRMMTANGWSCSRTSSGSSVAARSWSADRTPSRTRTTSTPRKASGIGAIVTVQGSGFKVQVPNPEPYNVPMPDVASFDITSTIDFQEVDNALNQARKEVGQRYDFKGATADITLNAADKTLTLTDRRRDEDERALGDRADAAGSPRRPGQELQGARLGARGRRQGPARDSRSSRASRSKPRARSSSSSRTRS